MYKIFSSISCVWKCDYGYFSKCFLFGNKSKYFFLLKKLFLILTHQNDLKAQKIINLK